MIQQRFFTIFLLSATVLLSHSSFAIIPAKNDLPLPMNTSEYLYTVRLHNKPVATSSAHRDRQVDAACAGTLLSPQVIITAAHCFDQRIGDPSVKIGLGGMENWGSFVYPLRIEIHEGMRNEADRVRYRLNTNRMRDDDERIAYRDLQLQRTFSDIMIIRLRAPIEGIPAGYQFPRLPNNHECSLVPGFGNRWNWQDNELFIRAFRTSQVGTEVLAREIYDIPLLSSWADPSRINAFRNPSDGTPRQNVHFQPGDSGTGLLVRNATGRPTLIGVISKADVDVNGVSHFANLCRTRDWISIFIGN